MDQTGGPCGSFAPVIPCSAERLLDSKAPIEARYFLTPIQLTGFLDSGFCTPLHLPPPRPRGNSLRDQHFHRVRGCIHDRVEPNI